MPVRSAAKESRVNIGQRVSFAIGPSQPRALGTVVSALVSGGYLVAIDAQFVGASQGILKLVSWFAAVSLTAI